MKEIYNLNVLPLEMINPHDCIIKKIILKENVLEFIFEENIKNYESIKNTNKNFKSLIIRYHLLDTDFSLYCWKQPNINESKKGSYEQLDNDIIKEISKSRLEYISHSIGYNSIIIKLFSETYKSIILKLDVSSIEYSWII